MLVHVLSGERELVWCSESLFGAPTEIINLPPGGPLDVLIRANEGGDCAYLRNVTPGGKVIDVELQRGVSISGRVEPMYATLLGRAVFRGAVLGFSFRQDGTFRLNGLPEGQTFLIEALGVWRGREWSASAKVQSGSAEVLLTLKAKG